MDSSFLTGFHITLGLFACLLLIKMIIQFGLPNHPARFVSYVVGLCLSSYFVGLAATDLNYVSPWDWIRWRSLPLIAGSLCLLFQNIMLIRSFSLIQQKVVSRVPLFAALLCYAIFPNYSDTLVSCFLVLGGVFLLISVKKARFQKRIYLKMLFLFLLHVGFNFINTYVAYVIGQMLLFFIVFYIFSFEHSFGIAAMMDDLKESLEGESK